MNIQNDMQKLLQKEMDRKEFIKHVGIGFAAILGITTVLKTISSMGGSQQKTVGYGSSTYGGSQSDSSQNNAPRKA